VITFFVLDRDRDGGSVVSLEQGFARQFKNAEMRMRKVIRDMIAVRLDLK
jgi:hypothetical protein